MQERDYINGFRFGFGASEGFDPYRELSTPPTSFGVAQMKARIAAFAEVRQQVRDSKRDQAMSEKARALSALAQDRDIHDAIVGAVQTPQTFTERLSLFWSNHFCLGRTSGTVSLLAGPHAQILRDYMFGRFSDLLKAATLSPAMMQYLNLQQSIGPNSIAGQKANKGLNENLGREILELHSLGVKGGYSQNDVGALSRLLTGWRYNGKTGEVGFSGRSAEPGTKMLLGHAIGGDKAQAADLEAAFEILARHMATAQYICEKLVLHFLGPGNPQIVKRMVDVFQTSQGQLRHVYAVMLEEAQSAEMLRNHYSNDVVFLISALRALPLRSDALNFEVRASGRPKSNPVTSGAFSQLRQKFWLAPSPAGWPDDPSYWMSASVMSARLRLIPKLVRLAEVQEPMAWAEHILGPLLRSSTRDVLQLAPNRLQGMGLVLASPEFNRR